MSAISVIKKLGLAIVFGFMANTAMAEADIKVGPDTCIKCHKSEVGVWEGTKHFSSFKEIHKSKQAKAIVAAVGGKRMKKTELCATCHYSTTLKKGKPKITSGPSCESCHGNATEWVNIHNDFGSAKNSAEEDPAHREERMAKAAAAGMIIPSRLFDVASNCMSCHGLANPKLDGKTAGAMLDAGHPLKAGFELVEYSQGSVLHRFYPPTITENKPLTDAEKSVVFVVGQAAALVSATEAVSKTDHAQYAAAQNERIAKAKSVLSQIPEAADLLAAPTVENGRKFGEAVKGKDYLSVVGSMMPTKYK